jgi:hypothetical protein
MATVFEDEPELDLDRPFLKKNEKKYRRHAKPGAPAVTHYHQPISIGGLWCAGSSLFWCIDKIRFFLVV